MYIEYIDFTRVNEINSYGFKKAFRYKWFDYFFSSEATTNINALICIIEVNKIFS